MPNYSDFIAAEAIRRGVSIGELAYEFDREARPAYVDGTPRPKWGGLSVFAKNSWEAILILPTAGPSTMPKCSAQS